MWKVAAVIGVMLLSLSPLVPAQTLPGTRPGAPVDPGTGGGPGVGFFVSGVSADVRKPFKTVVKIFNPGKERVWVDGSLPIVYHYTAPPGTTVAAERPDRPWVEDGQYPAMYVPALEVTLPGVKTPRGGAGWSAWLNGRGRNVEVGPGQSFLAEVEIPGVALAPGNCAIKLVLKWTGQVVASTEGVVVEVK